MQLLRRDQWFYESEVVWNRPIADLDSSWERPFAANPEI
jgi:hypothetical protein